MTRGSNSPSRSTDDGGYVHDPSRFDADGERIETDDGDPRPGADRAAERDGAGGDWIDDPVHPTAADREFDRRGWVLVGVVLLAFVVSPAAILLYPPEAEGYRFALIILPLFPAILLAITAVWATTRP